MPGGFHTVLDVIGDGRQVVAEIRAAFDEQFWATLPPIEGALDPLGGHGTVALELFVPARGSAVIETIDLTAFKDLLVVGTRAHGPIRRVLLGSTSSKLSMPDPLTGEPVSGITLFALRLGAIPGAMSGGIPDPTAPLTPSGNLHGMPVAALLGHGPKALVGWSGAPAALTSCGPPSR